MDDMSRSTARRSSPPSPPTYPRCPGVLRLPSLQHTSMAMLACKKCHPASRARTDLSVPDLKGAYHRQCMECHREWSKGTECTSCHLKREAGQSSAQALKAARLAGKSHPPLPHPGRVVYETPGQNGSVVTFFHDDHADRFGLRCVDCHRNESCVRCHEKKQADSTAGVKASTLRGQHGGSPRPLLRLPWIRKMRAVPHRTGEAGV
jgi:hypothetical protein